MAKKIRFPLQMNGTDVRTIEELRENFDLESVLGYFANGKLVTWLRNRYYDNEAMAVEALSANDSELNQKLMSILGVSADENAEEIDVRTIQKRNEKLMLLRQITDDQEIIENVDCVAFHQEELNQLLKEGKKKIYLCQGEFTIPICEADVTYTGISNPTVSIVVDDGSNIKLGNMVLNHIKCTSDSSDILLQLGMRYKNGDGVEKDDIKAIEYLKRAAELGNAEAQCELGLYYENKFLLEVYEDYDGAKRDYSEAVAYLEKAAEQGNARAQCHLGDCYYYNCNGFTPNYAKAIKWYRKAAEQGDMNAQRCLGHCYHFGEGIKEDRAEAVKWYRKAVEQGDAYAMFRIGSCYHRGGNGINKNYAEAVKWYCKAVEHGEKCASDIGDCYQEGGYGLNRNYTEARKWYRKALETGEIVPVYFSARGIASEAIP